MNTIQSKDHNIGSYIINNFVCLIMMTKIYT